MIYRYRIGQLKKILAMRAKISQDLHDEVGAILSSIQVYSSIASRAIYKEPEKAVDALHYIHKNANHVMENMSDIVWAINTGNTGNISLSGKLKDFGYEILTPLNINCDYKIDKEAENKLVNMEVRKNILLIAKEAMNNIAKHSHATETTVKLNFNAHYLELEISDNGIGLSKENGRSGNGLVNMEKRATALRGLFSIYSEPNRGTRILCKIPIARISDLS
jgi:signal transduction histidine kinase